MRGNPAKIKGKGFDKRPENINRKGRPKYKLVSSVIEAFEKEGLKPVTPEQIKTVYETLLNCTQERLAELIKDLSIPILIRIVGKEMLSGKGFETIEKMITRAQGNPQQSVKHSGEIKLGKDNPESEVYE